MSRFHLFEGFVQLSSSQKPSSFRFMLKTFKSPSESESVLRATPSVPLPARFGATLYFICDLKSTSAAHQVFSFLKSTTQTLRGKPWPSALSICACEKGLEEPWPFDATDPSVFYPHAKFFTSFKFLLRLPDIGAGIYPKNASAAYGGKKSKCQNDKVSKFLVFKLQRF